MSGDLLVAAEQGDIGEEQSDQPLALADRGRRVSPERGEVGGERADPGLLLVGERPVAGLGGALVIVFRVGELAQLVVPVGFELVGDEPVGRVHSEVATAGCLGGVLGALHAHLPDPVGVLGALGELGGDGERCLDRQRGELFEHELGEDSDVKVWDVGGAHRHRERHVLATIWLLVGAL